MNTMQILCFLKAAQCRNFTQSAADLFISQPAFSHNIAALEQEWGMELFIRESRHKRTRLTPAGAALYKGMRSLQEQYEELLQFARGIHEGKSGSLRIGLQGSERIDEYTLKILDHFQKKFPNVEVSLRRGSYCELIRWLKERTLDIAFTLLVDVQDREWIYTERLYNMESVLLLSAAHPLAGRSGLSLADFRDDVFVSLSARESHAISNLLTEECKKAGFAPKVLEAKDINEQILYLEAGRGIAIASINNMAAFNQNIKQVSVKELHPMEVVMAWNLDNYNPCISLFYSTYEPINETNFTSTEKLC